jgi:hypothetical protein
MREVTHPSWLEAATLLRGEVGSGAHGIAVAGTDDRDEMGICLEPFELAWATDQQFEQYIYRSAAEREGRQDAPSMPGDLDLTVYSLRKWCRLALNGNPTVLMLLFLPQHLTVAKNAHGSRLQALAPAFASRRAIKAFSGYLQAQRQRLIGERGQRNVNRQKLVDAHGFDTKYASHMVRLGFQGVEYGTTGTMTLPMSGEELEMVRAIRAGKIDLNSVMTLAGDLEAQLRDLTTSSHLPDQPDTKAVNEWMRDAYIAWWHTQSLDSQWRRKAQSTP